MKQALLIFTILFTILSSCKKEKAETGLVGNWLIQSQSSQAQFSGEMVLNKEGTGTVAVYTSILDTQFYRDIKSFEVIDHSKDRDWSPGGGVIHWYQAYMNDDIYCHFQSSEDGDIVNQKTNQINFHISSQIDNNTGESTEDYNLDLLLTKE